MIVIINQDLRVPHLESFWTANFDIRQMISRGHREDGRLGSVKNFKTPFF